MVMPGKRSLKFYQLEVLPVELTDDPRIPVILDQGKLLSEIDLVHKRQKPDRKGGLLSS
jgi:hypothetical protein